MSQKNRMHISDRGAATVYIAAVVSVLVALSAPVFIRNQLHYSKKAALSKTHVKGLLTARSGISYGLEKIRKELGEEETPGDTGVMFGDDPFSDDTAYFEKEEPLIEEGELSISLFSGTDQGECILSAEPRGNVLYVVSKGVYMGDSSHASAGLASRVFRTPDTVLYLEKKGEVTGSGLVDGEKVFQEDASSELRKRFKVSKDLLKRSIKEYRTALSNIRSAEFPGTPLNITASEELIDIPDTVKGPLFIDGTGQRVSGEIDKTVYALEEVQITGDVHIKDITIAADKDVKLLDNAHLENVEVYTSARFYISGNSVFSGSCIARGDIEVFQEAEIRDKSIFISIGEMKRENIKERKPFSIFFRDEITADGVFIDLRGKGGISTSEGSLIKGILWSNSEILHNGIAKGFVRAGRLISRNINDTTSGNFLEGDINRLDKIDEYWLPYYIGQPEILTWREW